MAVKAKKKKTIKLQSSQSNFCYYTKGNLKKKVINKYAPDLRKHIPFNATKAK